MKCVVSALVVFLSVPCVLAQGAVLVVDAAGGPGSQFTQIQPAIDAALDGDVILVRPGAYGEILIDGKALVIAADSDSASKPSLGHGASTVKNLAPGQSFVLRNFQRTTDEFAGPFAAFAIEQCLGPVLIEDCAFLGGDPAMRVSASARVVLARCTLTGFEYVPVFPWGSGHAFEAADSTLTMYDCTLVGAAGSDGENYVGPPPEPGEPAASMTGGSLFASGCVFQGGAGGDGNWYHLGGCSNGAPGGAGLLVAGGTPQIVSVDCAFRGGVGGAGTSACLPGGGGWPIELNGGTTVPLSGPRYALTSTSPLRELQPGKLELLGATQLHALVFASTLQSPLLELAWKGVLVPAPPLLWLGGGDAYKGYLALPFSVQDLGPGVPAAQYFVQAAMIDTATFAVVLSAPTHVLLLDQSL